MAINSGRAKIIEPSELENEKEDKKKNDDIPTDARGICGFVYDTWRKWSEERNSKELVWLECERAYLSKHSPNQNTARWKSKAFVPVSFNAVENIHSQIMAGLFPSQDFFDVTPVQEGFDARASAVRSLLAHQLSESNFRDNFSAFLKQLITIGNSAAMVDWVVDRSGKSVISECSRFTPLDMKYFHVDPFCSDPQRGNKMRRYWLTEDEAESLGWFVQEGIEEAAETSSAGGTIEGNEDANRRTAAQEADLTSGIDRDRGPLDIFELWGTFEYNGERFENYVVSVANGKLLRMLPSPYLDGRDPFIFCRYANVAGEAYGIGALEPALPLQYLINTFTNQKVDELSVIINGMFKYVDDGVIDVDNLISEPSALFEVGDINNLQRISPDTSVTMAYTEISDLERKFEEATGAIKLVAGGTPNMARTATEVMALTQSGNSRFAEQVANIESTGVTPALRKYIGNAKQFMKKAVSVRILGEAEPAWIEVSPQDVSHEYTIRAGGSRLVGMRELRMRNLMQYIQIIGQIAPIAQRMDWDKLDRRIWRELGFDDSQSMLKPEQLVNAGMGAPQGAPPQGTPTNGQNPAVDQMMMGMMGGMPGGGKGGLQ